MHEFERYLDTGEEPKDQESQELAQLLREVARLDDTPDPGQAYWNQFNSRLQQRLETRPKRRAWFLRTPILGGLGTAMMAAAALWFFVLPNAAPQDLTLDMLSGEQLALIYDVYEDSAILGDEDEIALADNDWDILLDAVGDDTYFEDGMDDIDPEALMDLWKEG